MDRNIWGGRGTGKTYGSLSARRAWIEIVLPGLAKRLKTVALRKESVDRNKVAKCKKTMKQVALRKESVDRNLKTLADGFGVICRSPQGERG